MKTLKTWVAAAAMVVLTGASQAALVDLGDGTVKDTNTNLIWLYDWNSPGSMNWGEAKTWAAGLTVGGAAAGDWRLPEIAEFADLWANPDIGSSGPGLYGEFANVQSNFYWSGTEDAASPGRAWTFLTLDGSHHVLGKLNVLYAVAVRTGDVAAPVPEPQTLALALLALGATVAARRRRPA